MPALFNTDEWFKTSLIDNRHVIHAYVFMILKGHFFVLSKTFKVGFSLRVTLIFYNQGHLMIYYLNISFND